MGTKLYIKTYGCQMNEYDSQKTLEILKQDPTVEETTNPEDADIILLNTCSIREKAEEKVYSELGRLRKLKVQNPNLKIVLGLGKIGFESFLHFTRKSHDIKMKDYPFKHGVGYSLPNGIALYGAYHPSPRNVNTKTITFDMMVKFLKKLKNEI